MPRTAGISTAMRPALTGSEALPSADPCLLPSKTHWRLSAHLSQNPHFREGWAQRMILAGPAKSRAERPFEKSGCGQGSRIKLACEDLEHVIVVPGGLFAPTAKAGLTAAISGDEVEGDFA